MAVFDCDKMELDARAGGLGVGMKDKIGDFNTQDARYESKVTDLDFRLRPSVTHASKTRGRYVDSVNPTVRQEADQRAPCNVTLTAIHIPC